MPPPARAGADAGSSLRLANARSHCSASAGVKNALSFNSRGRSSGVVVAEFQIPSKFGRWLPVPRCPATSVGIRSNTAATPQSSWRIAPDSSLPGLYGSRVQVPHSVVALKPASVLAIVTNWAPGPVAIALAVIASIVPVKLLNRFQ